MWNGILNGLGWLLMQIYLLVPDFAAAIIIFSLVTKLIMLPFGMKSKKSNLRMQKLQPKSKAIEAKFKDDKQRAQLEIQKMYKAEGVSQFGGCLWTLLPLPILFALFYVVRLPLSHMMGISPADIARISELEVITNWVAAHNISLADLATNQLPLMNAIHNNFAAVVSELGDFQGRLLDISFNFFGLNLSYVPTTRINAYMILPIISAASAFANSVMMQKLQVPISEQQAQQQSSMKFMTYLSPIMSLAFGFMMPSVMSLYWTVNTLFGMAQEYVTTKYYRKVLKLPTPAELKEQERLAKEELEALERARRERLERLAQEGPQTPKRNAMSNKKYKQLKAQQGIKPRPASLDSDDESDNFDDDESEYAEDERNETDD